MEIHNEYEPHSWQIDAHKDPNTHLALCGGKGCVASGTKIWTEQGLVAIEDVGERSGVLSLGKFGFQPSEARRAFPKGKGNLYRVVHTHGEFVVTEHHHVYASSGMYRPLRDLSVGEQILTSQAPQESIEELFREGYGEGGENWKRRPLSSLERYSGCMSQYGLQLLQALSIDPIVFQQLAYAQGFGPVACSSALSREDAHTAQKLTHSHNGLFGDQNYTRCFSRRMTDLFVALVDRIAPKSSGHTFLEALRLLQSLCSFSNRPKDPESSLPSLALSLDQYSSISTIESIEKVGYDWYWDLSVSEVHNYIDEYGAIHHNSGKSCFCIQELFACAMEYAGTKWIIARQTYQSLKDTTWADFYEAIPEQLIKSYNKSEMIITLINDSKFYGRSLDNPKKFDSMVIAGFFIDEADETKEDGYKTLKSRIRQMVMIDGVRTKPRYRSMLSFNPPDEDHWIIVQFTEDKPKNHSIYFCSTLNNMQNLPEGYIDELKATYSEDMQQRIIHGLPGRVHKGRPVYPQFKTGNYIWPLEADPKAPIFRSWDFGYNRPACVWLQYINGQARILAELLGKQIYLEDFIKTGDNKLGKPQQSVFGLQKELFPDHPAGYKDFCDPRGTDESDKGVTSVKILNDHGIYPVHRRTFIKEGVKIVKEHLDQKTSDGEPRLLIHGRCKNLIEGFRGGYHRLDGEDDPEKDGYYDHLQDVVRYALVHLGMRWRSNSLSVHLNQNVMIHPITGRRIEM